MPRRTVASNKLILYEKSFPLAKGLTFSRFMKALQEKNFSPYVVHIDNMSSTESYYLEVLYVPDIFQPGFGLVDPILRPVLLNKSIMEFSKNKKEITLIAYPDLEGSLPIILFWGLLATIMTFILMPISILLSFSVIVITLLIGFAIYRRDISRYEAIRSLAIDWQENQKEN